MVVVNGVAVGLLPASFGEWRKHEHANRAVAEVAAVFGFIPDDDQGATLLVLG